MMNRSPADRSFSAKYALVLLLTVNMLNYVDRQALYAVFPLIKSDLQLSDASLGLLGSAFMVSYMLAAPFFGYLGDKTGRCRLAAGGLIIWSLATLCSGVVSTYRMLSVSRALVGVGEASFATVSPGLVADFFGRESRGRVMALFFLATPVGSATGYILGGVLGQQFGWQNAFLMVGIPGLLLAVPLWRLVEPAAIKPSAVKLKEISFSAGFRSFIVNRTFVFTTLSMTAMTFAIGGLAQWLPSFLNRVHALDVGRANLFFGSITVVAGIVGTLSGGWLGDYLTRRTVAGQLYVSAAGFLLGTPLAVMALTATTLSSCLMLITIAEILLFLNTGPLNTVLLDVLPTGRRSMGFAVTIFFIHALGDAISPAIIGVLSDRWGLRSALLIAPIATAAAGIFAIYSSRFIALDQLAAVGCDDRQK